MVVYPKVKASFSGGGGGGGRAGRSTVGGVCWGGGGVGGGCLFVCTSKTAYIMRK